jgi:glucoamylase
MPPGKQLRLVLLSPAQVHWSFDNWWTVQDTDTRDTGLGLHAADLPSNKLAPGSVIVFTFFWTEIQQWEGKDFFVVVEND